MKLKDLIRGKKADGSSATATHATLATIHSEEDRTVANVATVSVANPWKDEAQQLKEDTRQQRVLDMLESDPDRKYAVLVDDATTDPVTVTVGIRGLAIFDLEIPHAHYDGIALLQVIEQHSTDTALNLSSDTCPLPEAKECSLGLPDESRRRAA